LDADLANYAYTECRALGHQWRHVRSIKAGMGDKNHRAPMGIMFGSVGYVSVCRACGKDRVKWITRSGKTDNRYTDPEGYRVDAEHAPTASQWRATYVASLFDDITEEGTTDETTSSRRRSG